MKPEKGSYPPYFENYISLVTVEDVHEGLTRNLSHYNAVVSKFPAEMGDFAYAQGKWTVKQLLCHINDTERIFAYRALRFARRDPQMVLAFDENTYAANASVQSRSIKDLRLEFESVRIASISLFRSFTPDDLIQLGKMSLGATSVLALGFMMSGHCEHHLRILMERYTKN